MNYRAKVVIMPHSELLDPQGKAVLGGLHNMQMNEIKDVRVGKNITLTIEADSAETARSKATEAAEKLLANQVMEVFEVEVEALS